LQQDQTIKYGLYSR